MSPDCDEFPAGGASNMRSDVDHACTIAAPQFTILIKSFKYQISIHGLLNLLLYGGVVRC